VPYCRDVAAPVFGMVCAKHKDLPKAKIKAYREARRAKKLGLKPANRARRTSRAVAAKKVKAAGRKVATRKISKPRTKVGARAPKKIATTVASDRTPPASTAPPPPPSPSAA
jgi:hypothetical protein